MRREHTLRDRDTHIVPASVPTTAHGISMAALLPLAAGEAARGSFLRAVAVASHAALLIIAAWRHLRKDVIFLGDPEVDSFGAVWSGSRCPSQQSWLD